MSTPVDLPETAAGCRAEIKKLNRRILEAERLGTDPRNIAEFRKQRDTLKLLKSRLNRRSRDRLEPWRFECTPAEPGSFWQERRGWLADERRAQERLLAEPDDEFIPLPGGGWKRIKRP
jgi:hypothetical protein